MPLALWGVVTGSSDSIEALGTGYHCEELEFNQGEINPDHLHNHRTNIITRQKLKSFTALFKNVCGNC